MSVTERFAGWSAGHPRPVVFLWSIAVLAGIIFWRGADHSLTPHISLLGESEAIHGGRLIEARLGVDTSTTQVICASEGFDSRSAQDGQIPVEVGGANTPSTAGIVSSIGRCYESRWQAVGDNVSPSTLPDPERAFGIIGIVSPSDREAGSDETRRGLSLLLPPLVADSSLLEPSNGKVVEDIRAIAQDDIVRAERVGLPLAFLILLIVTRGIVSSVIPIVVGVAGVVLAAGATVLIGDTMPMSIYALNMIVMIGLAVGIDYTLLCLARYREILSEPTSPTEAIATTISTAGRAVVTSGTTVIVAMAGLLLVPISVFRDIAFGAMLVVALCVFAVLTLFPALASLLGRRIVWPRRIEASERQSRGVGWGRLAGAVAARPVLCGLAVLIPLVLLSVQALEFEGGLSAPQAFLQPDSSNRAQPDYLEEELSATLLSVVEIVVSSTSSDGADAAIGRLIAELGNDRDFAPVLTLETNDTGDLSVLTVLVVRPADSPAAAAALERLRGDFIPQAFDDGSAAALVSGPLAMQSDVLDSIWIWQIRIALLVLATSVIFLALMFRTVVVPIVAALTTMLSVGAGLGLLVLVVQQGHGASWLGLEQAPAIETWVPIVLFCIVFGLGMDYHVFLVSRIRERYQLTQDSTASIAFGLRSTASVVCGAALIMVVVFGCFATGRLLMLQQVGFGLAVAVAIDALLVRLVLVPAVMIVLGRRNWYLPGFLRWIPGDKGV